MKKYLIKIIFVIFIVILFIFYYKITNKNIIKFNLPENLFFYLSKTNSKKLIFISSNQNEFSECIITHIRLIKDLIDLYSCKKDTFIYIVGYGKKAYNDLLIYKKIFKINNKIIFININISNLKNYKYPLFLILDKNNNIIKIWKADVLKIEQTISIIKKEFNIPIS